MAKHARIYKGRIIIPSETALNKDLVAELVNLHKSALRSKYERMRRMYEGHYEILDQRKKAAHKPDNRLVANFAKYLTDIFNGYFIGIPVKVMHDDEDVQEYLEFVRAYNNMDDNDAEISKDCDICGVGVELLYMDEDSNVGATHTDPEEAFVVYDDSILHRPLYGIRYYKNAAGQLEGTLSDDKTVYHFNSSYVFTDETPHVFGSVPIIEYDENEERIGLFETVETLINAFNAALSEKANDVQYFADAYLAILGKMIDKDTLKTLRDNRIINMAGTGVDKMTVEFLEKPNGDETQEHLLDRLMKLIFRLAMVCDISDEEFGNASGESLAYKLLQMDNLANAKERKFTAGLQKRYKLIAHTPLPNMAEDDWLGISYKFTRNVPKNVKEEAEVARALQGITSRETQLSVLSVVHDPKAELEKIDSEEGLSDYPMYEDRVNE